MSGVGEDRAVQPRTSLWAIVSLLAGISIWCPVTVVAAPLLGFRALVEIKANPGMRGRGAALAGIWLGLAGIVLWIVMAILWHAYARTPMLQGPVEELNAGLRGDLAAFKSGFAGPGAAAGDDEADAFLSEISQRYGRLIEITQDRSVQDGGDPLQGPAVIPIPYVLRFEHATVKAEAAFVTFGEARVIPDPIFKWASIRIIDPERGDLTYPAPPTSAAATQNDTQ